MISPFPCQRPKQTRRAQGLAACRTDRIQHDFVLLSQLGLLETAKPLSTFNVNYMFIFLPSSKAAYLPHTHFHQVMEQEDSFKKCNYHSKWSAKTEEIGGMHERI